MCTLTWLFNAETEGYSLFFNRDELKTRKRALPPQPMQTDCGVNYLAPTDTDAGGTWLAVNQFGLTICLLNNYVAKEPKTDNLKSRGEIVRALAGCETTAAAEQILTSMDLSNYRGFDVVIIQHIAIQLSWDSEVLSRLIPEIPVTSSSYHSESVCHTRRDYFESLENKDDINVLQQFHSCHINDDLSPMNGKPEYADSVCMHREYAKTVSQCLVQVSLDQVSIAYSDGAPCETVAGPLQVLQRRAAA